MIVFDPGAGEPARWVVCFCRKAATPWMARLPVGHYKHVRAFGSVPHIQTWVFFDPALDRSVIKLARGEAAGALMAEFLADSDALVMPVRYRERLVPRIGGWCVPAVKHLLGLSSSALRPDALWKHCLRHGGYPLDEGANLHPAADRSACGAVRADGGKPDDRRTANAVA